MPHGKAQIVTQSFEPPRAPEAESLDLWDIRRRIEFHGEGFGFPQRSFPGVDRVDAVLLDPGEVSGLIPPESTTTYAEATAGACRA